MTNANDASASALAQTSTPRPVENNPDFLQQQADNARDAIQVTLRDLAHDLSKGASPISWAKQFPWVSLGAAAAAGFLIAKSLTPKSDETFKQKWEDLIADLHQKAQSVTDQVSEPNSDPQQPKSPHSFAKSLFAKLLEPALEVAKTAVTATLSSIISSTVSPNHDDNHDNHNNHDGQSPSPHD